MYFVVISRLVTAITIVTAVCGTSTPGEGQTQMIHVFRKAQSSRAPWQLVFDESWGFNATPFAGNSLSTYSGNTGSIRRRVMSELPKNTAIQSQLSLIGTVGGIVTSSRRVDTNGGNTTVIMTHRSNFM